VTERCYFSEAHLLNASVERVPRLESRCAAEQDPSITTPITQALLIACELICCVSICIVGINVVFVCDTFVHMELDGEDGLVGTKARQMSVEPSASCYLRIENAEGYVLIAIYLFIYLFVCVLFAELKKY